MQAASSRSSVTLALLLGFFAGNWGYACGGAAEKAQGTAGTAGNSGSNASTGGNVSTGGNLSSGGGTSSAGSGAGAGIAAECLLPKDSGPCEAALRAYFHNPKTGVCEPFIYGGCEGNANRFDSEAACQAKCFGGTPDMDRCDKPSDCMIASAGCCGACAEQGREAIVVINVDYNQERIAAIGCSGVACSPCPPVAELKRQSQYFTATCENHQCRVVDIRETALTDCAKPEDCRLRMGSGCCEGCAPEGAVAVNTAADFKAYCPSAPTCPKCAAQLPEGVQATCVERKCKVIASP